jgi:exonuclease III
MFLKKKIQQQQMNKKPTGMFYCLLSVLLVIMLAGLKFSCLNVNSLNMSTANKGCQLRKILGIVKLKSDVIFLSDVRLSNRNMVSSKGDVINLLRTNKFASYSAFFNSTKNKRGVAILINNNLSFSVEAEIRDEEENVLLLRCNIGGDMCIIGAIYGPNNFDINFLEFLHREVTALGDYPIVLGGDWNMTFSNLPIDVCTRMPCHRNDICHHVYSVFKK